MSHERERRPAEHEHAAHHGPKPRTTPSGRPSRQPAIGGKEAASVVTAAAAVLAETQYDDLPYLTPRDRTAMWNLRVANTGRDGGQPVDGARRLAALDDAMEVLGPAIEATGRDDGSREWLEDYIEGPLQTVRDNVEYSVATDRVQRSVLVDGDRVVDPETAASPREQAALLHVAMPKLIATVRQLNDLVARLPEEQIEDHVKEVIAAHSQGRAKFQSLVELGNALTLLDALLLLSDDELRQRYDEASTIIGKATDFTELLKGVVAFTGGCMGIVGSLTGMLARIAGMPDAASLASAFAAEVAWKLGPILTAIEVAHGILVLIDSRSGTQEKVDASVDVASGALWLGRHAIEGAGPASMALETGYAIYRASLAYAAEAALGLESGILRTALQKLSGDGADIASVCPDVAKALALAKTESDPERKLAMERVLTNKAAQLRGLLQILISDLQPPDLEAGMASVPGRYQILREAMAPLLERQIGNTPDEVLQAGKLAVDRIVWILQHADQIELAAARGKGLEAVADKREGGSTDE